MEAYKYGIIWIVFTDFCRSGTSGLYREGWAWTGFHPISSGIIYSYECYATGPIANK